MANKIPGSPLMVKILIFLAFGAFVIFAVGMLWQTAKNTIPGLTCLTSEGQQTTMCKLMDGLAIAAGAKKVSDITGMTKKLKEYKEAKVAKEAKEAEEAARLAKEGKEGAEGLEEGLELLKFA